MADFRLHQDQPQLRYSHHPGVGRKGDGDISYKIADLAAAPPELQQVRHGAVVLPATGGGPRHQRAQCVRTILDLVLQPRTRAGQGAQFATAAR